jgi:hypothetical protein
MGTNVDRPTRRPPSLLFACSLLFASHLACADAPNSSNVDEPAIDVGEAEPQSVPVPSGSADDPDLPQIIAVEGPETALLGQIVTLRVTSNFDPIEDVADVAIVLADTDTWFKVAAEAQPAPDDAPGKWQFLIPAAIAADPSAAGTELALDIGLLLDGDHAGGYSGWVTTLGGADEIVMCPADADCEGRSCGLDPLCATSCGVCTGGQACTLEGQCEGVGGACPEAADCSGLECGFDPICGTTCGVCDAGLGCVSGSCQMGGGDCCANNETPGCDNPDIAGCVCETDRFCCETSWDQQCVDQATQECGAC